MTEPELSIVVFAYEEEENVGPILAELGAWLDENAPSSEILFVDDGSRDQTAAAAKRALAGRAHLVLRHDRNRGIGAALKTGVMAARGRFVTFLPADGQIDPDALRALCEAQREENADVVLSLYDRRDDGLDRKVFSFGVRALIYAVHGVWLKSDGPYLFRRKLFDPEQLRPDTFFLNFEFPIRALAAGLRISTVVIKCRPRRAGHSKSTQWHRIVGVARDLFELRARRARGE